jgi:hypothetical protein
MVSVWSLAHSVGSQAVGRSDNIAVSRHGTPSLTRLLFESHSSIVEGSCEVDVSIEQEAGWSPEMVRTLIANSDDNWE